MVGPRKGTMGPDHVPNLRDNAIRAGLSWSIRAEGSVRRARVPSLRARTSRSPTLWSSSPRPRLRHPADSDAAGVKTRPSIRGDGGRAAPSPTSAAPAQGFRAAASMVAAQLHGRLQLSMRRCSPIRKRPAEFPAGNWELRPSGVTCIWRAAPPTALALLSHLSGNEITSTSPTSDFSWCRPAHADTRVFIDGPAPSRSLMARPWRGARAGKRSSPRHQEKPAHPTPKLGGGAAGCRIRIPARSARLRGLSRDVRALRHRTCRTRLHDGLPLALQRRCRRSAHRFVTTSAVPSTL